VRFSRPGHAVTGDRHVTGAEKRARIGYEWVHASSTTTPATPAASSTATNAQRPSPASRARLAHFAELGIEPKRLIGDDAWTYTRNTTLARLLARQGVRHLLIPYRRQQVNGTVEPFQQTLRREWGLGRSTAPATTRAEALSHWLSYYNKRRPHSSLGGQPPTSCAHNVPRQDS
jgi:transposase InsO family protein